VVVIVVLGVRENFGHGAPLQCRRAVERIP
jgi:hypothetical protein